MRAQRSASSRERGPGILCRSFESRIRRRSRRCASASAVLRGSGGGDVAAAPSARCATAPLAESRRRATSARSRAGIGRKGLERQAMCVRRNRELLRPVDGDRRRATRGKSGGGSSRGGSSDERRARRAVKNDAAPRRRAKRGDVAIRPTACGRADGVTPAGNSTRGALERARQTCARMRRVDGAAALDERARAATCSPRRRRAAQSRAARCRAQSAPLLSSASASRAT